MRTNRKILTILAKNRKQPFFVLFYEKVLSNMPRLVLVVKKLVVILIVGGYNEKVLKNHKETI